MRGNSRQTDLKLPLCIGLRAFATRPAICLSPPSHGSKRSERPMSLACHDLCHADATIARVGSVASVASPSAGIVGGGLVELAVERRAADLQPARDLGHLAAIMRDREADDLVLHLLERPHFAGRRSASQGCRQRAAAQSVFHYPKPWRAPSNRRDDQRFAVRTGRPGPACARRPAGNPPGRAGRSRS